MATVSRATKDGLYLLQVQMHGTTVVPMVRVTERKTSMGFSLPLHYVITTIYHWITSDNWVNPGSKRSVIRVIKSDGGLERCRPPTNVVHVYGSGTFHTFFHTPEFSQMINERESSLCKALSYMLLFLSTLRSI